LPKLPASHRRLSRPAVVTSKRAGRSEYRGAIPDRVRAISLAHLADRLRGLIHFPLPLFTCALSMEVKLSERETPFNAEIKKIGAMPPLLVTSSWRDSFNGATAPVGPRPPHYRGFTITLRFTTISRAPLDERPARSTDLCVTTHNAHKR
jgi:hypothetical protein